MKKIINKIKLYKPPKYICFLYFFIPVFISFLTILTKEEDIWFLLNHGKYVLTNGFPFTEPFTIHSNFSFVMQQWLSAVIFYLAYSIFGKFGLLGVVVLVNFLILFFLYKLCMLLSNNKYTISTIITCITDLLLMIFILPRPQIFTFLLLIITLYIMELFYKNRSSKSIYFLVLISLLQINLHASMWFMLYLFMLPYLIDYVFLYIKNKDKRLFKLLGIIVIMLLVGLINPYGIDNILYVFNSYGNPYINDLIYEMLPPTMGSIYGDITYILIGIVLLIYIFYRKNKIKCRHFLLLMGVTFLTLSNIRSLSLYIIGSFPFLSSYLKKLMDDSKIVVINDKKTRINYIIILIFLSFYTVIMATKIQPKFDDITKLDGGVNYLLKNYKKEDIRLYTNYNNGSYCEYRGIKTYIDTRAEVFLKSNNKKEDIFKEYYYVQNGLLDYDKFLNKYNFTHLLIDNDERLYKYILNNKNYKIIYKSKKYAVFEKIN